MVFVYYTYNIRTTHVNATYIIYVHYTYIIYKGSKYMNFHFLCLTKDI